MGCHAHVELFPFFHCLVGTRFSHQLSTHIERVTKRDFSCMKSHCGIFVRFSVTIIFEPFSLRLAGKKHVGEFVSSNISLWLVSGCCSLRSSDVNFLNDGYGRCHRQWYGPNIMIHVLTCCQSSFYACTSLLCWFHVKLLTATRRFVFMWPVLTCHQCSCEICLGEGWFYTCCWCYDQLTNVFTSFSKDIGQPNMDVLF